jgi:hypothetical protein
MIVDSGLGGIITCDTVVDSDGNAVDCSAFSGLFNSACWTPIAPCAAAGSVVGQPATVDNSLSQLGPVVAGLIETPGATSTYILIGVAIIAAILIFRR